MSLSPDATYLVPTERMPELEEWLTDRGEGWTVTEELDGFALVSMARTPAHESKVRVLGGRTEDAP